MTKHVSRGRLPLTALLRRHRLAMAIVLSMAACLACLLKSAPVSYSDSSTVVFGAAIADVSPSPAIVQSLIVSETMMAETMTSPAMVQQVRAAGGTAPFTMVPFNVYNLQYPDYAEPTATLTASSASETAAQRTFRIVLRLLTQRLAAIQAAAGVPTENRIRIGTVGSTGTLAQPGSEARTFGGLALLTLIAAISVANLLDRRRAGARGQRPAATSGAVTR